MKKNVKTIVALLAALMAAGCQKELPVVAESSVANSDIIASYSAGAMNGSVNLPDEQAWDDFLDKMFALAREGFQVTISTNPFSHTNQTKDVVTFTTTDEAEAKHWTKQMANEGYEVNISYDNKTGIYTCTAVK